MGDIKMAKDLRTWSVAVHKKEKHRLKLTLAVSSSMQCMSTAIVCASKPASTLSHCMLVPMFDAGKLRLGRGAAKDNECSTAQRQDAVR